MACKYTYKGITYNSKEEFINQVINPQFLSNKKVRRVMELQSDLFQKGRDRSDLVTKGLHKDDAEQIGATREEYEQILEEIRIKENTNSSNQFLQLLNKDNNWVTFFVKSIIQDTAKQTITEVQESDVEAKVKELEKEGLLEIDCKGKLKAENGYTTNSNPKFGDWEIIKDLTGKPSHKQGGVDLNIKGNTIEAEGNELVLRNSIGDIAIIPKKHRLEIKDMIADNCDNCLNNYISKLPKNPKKAGDGGVYSDKYVRNNFFNRVFRRNDILEKQIMDENKALYNVGKLKDFKVLEATGKSKQHLQQTNRNPEYFPKGDTWFPYLDDASQPIKLPNKNKYRTLIDDDNLNDTQLKDAVKFDFISHALHSDKRYNELSNQLHQKLLSKYDQKFIDNNGGVDAYVRGILSDSEDYKPYKDETSFIEPEFINELKNYVKTGK